MCDFDDFMHDTTLSGDVGNVSFTFCLRKYGLLTLKSMTPFYTPLVYGAYYAWLLCACTRPARTHVYLVDVGSVFHFSACDAERIVLL